MAGPYYVRKSGLDSNDGLSAGAAFLTIDKAANTVVANTTVYVGAGTYRELVRMDTAGTAGNQIEYIADVDGSQTGDAGLVIISAYDDEQTTAARATCIDADGTGLFEYTTFRGFVMTGGTVAVFDAAGTGNNTFVGSRLEDCLFIAGPQAADLAAAFDYNNLATNVSPGLVIERCMFVGAGIKVEHHGHATTDFDAGVSIDSCVFVGLQSTSPNNAAINWELGTVSTNQPTMGTVSNCTFYGKYHSIEVDTSAAEGSVIARNNTFIHCVIALSGATATSPTQIDSDYNTFAGVSTRYVNTDAGVNDRDLTVDPGLLGGLADMPLHRFWGWSPFRPWEPISQADPSGSGAYLHPSIGDASSADAPAFDLYNETRPMGVRGSDKLDVYFFDGSDDAAADPGAVWTNETNFDDKSTATVASTTTLGSESADYLWMGGTEAPASGGTISSVQARIYNGTCVDSLLMRVATDGWGETLMSAVGSTNDNQWVTWKDLSVPSGGWTWAKVQALEIRCWANGTSGVEAGTAQVRVSSGADNHDDRGAIEARVRPTKDTSSKISTGGANSMQFAGAGFHDFFVPVDAVSTTITVVGEYDSNYTGTLPSMTVSNDDIMTEVTDTMTAAANTEETLTTGSFSPSAAGIVKVRITSSDTSGDGLCWFDVVSVS